jgi:hypothetical protein
MAYGLVALVGAGTISGIWWHGNSHGKRTTEAAYQKAVEGLRNESRKLADSLEQAQQANREATKVKTRTIYLEPDPTGCADLPALPGLLGALRPSPSGPATDQRDPGP